MRDDLCYMIQRVVNSRRVKNFDASSAWVRMSTRVSVTEGLRFSPAWRVFVACFLAFFLFFLFHERWSRFSGRIFFLDSRYFLPARSHWRGGRVTPRERQDGIPWRIDRVARGSPGGINEA